MALAPQHPIDYSINGDTVDSMSQKIILEFVDIYTFLNKVFTNYAGTIEPSGIDLQPYVIWNDTSSNLIKQRNATNTDWIIKGLLNEPNTVAATYGTSSPPVASRTGKLYIKHDTKQIYFDNGTQQVLIGTVNWDDLLNKPTTINGYGITDAVNISEVVNIATPNKLLRLDGNSKLPASITGDANTIGGVALSGLMQTSHPANAITGFGQSGTATTVARSDHDHVSISGNAATATKLQTARTFSLAGDATGNVTFDGSANATITATLANSGVTAGTYKSVMVDAKGRVTTGTNPTTLAGYGITDAVNTSDVVTTATANKILKLDANAKLPASITGDADTVDGHHAGTAAGNVLVLDNNGKGPISITGDAASVIAAGIGVNYMPTATDLNSIVTGGKFYTYTTAANRPEDYCTVENTVVGPNDMSQLAIGLLSGKIWVRKKSNGTWSSWQQVFPPVYAS